MKFTKKPITVEAKRFIVDNADECIKFIGEDTAKLINDKIVIVTLEGEMTASIGDWIIKGISNEFYPCRNAIFEKTYEPV